MQYRERVSLSESFVRGAVTRRNVEGTGAFIERSPCVGRHRRVRVGRVRFLFAAAEDAARRGTSDNKGTKKELSAI